jgi:hypothetical protein
MKKLPLAVAWGFAILYAASPWLPLYVTVGELRIPIAQIVQPVANVIEPLTMPVTIPLLKTAAALFVWPVRAVLAVSGVKWTARDVVLAFAHGIRTPDDLLRLAAAIATIVVSAAIWLALIALARRSLRSEPTPMPIVPVRFTLDSGPLPGPSPTRNRQRSRPVVVTETTVIVVRSAARITGHPESR